MNEILCYMPTYSPNHEAEKRYARPYTRISNEEISERIRLKGSGARCKPWVYMDCIDAVLNTRPDIKLVVADGRSTDSIRTELTVHQKMDGNYDLSLYDKKLSQWVIFNDIIKDYSKLETKYFVYTSSDIIWPMDWVGEAIKAFEKDPTLMILFPLVSSGDPVLPCQVAEGPRDDEPFEPPYQDAARAPVLNAYAMIFRMDFLRFWQGYPTIFRNCFTESFLWYLCKAVGGKMGVLPRGWCYHHNGVDEWTGAGGSYHYLEEKSTFDRIMDAVQEAESKGELTPQFLRDILWAK